MEIPFSTLGHSEVHRFGRSIRFGNASKIQGPEFLSRPFTSTSTRSCSFGLGKRLTLINRHHLQCPGPNTYSITPEPLKGTTIQGRPDSKKTVQRNSNLPGPGSYELYQESPCKKKIILKTQSKYKAAAPSPGPSEYNLNVKWIMKNTTGGFIPLAKKAKTFKEKKEELLSPGPGSYKIPSCFGEQAMQLPVVHYKKKK